MKHEFKVGDHVSWNSEAGHVRGTIKKKVTTAIKLKSYTVLFVQLSIEKKALYNMM